MREMIVAEARAWIGTPFKWQASLKGVGADCKGLVVGVARGCGLPEAASVHAAMQGDWRRRVDARLLLEGMKATFRRVTEPLPGDVLLLRLAGKPQHLAILTAPNRMVHTYGLGPDRVIEVPFTSCWKSALHSAWTWPSLEPHHGC